MLQSRRLEAVVHLQRDPWRLTIRELRPGIARWRFARMHQRRAIGFIAALMPPPQRPASEAAPRERPPQRGPRADRPAAGGSRRRLSRVQFNIERADLDGLTATFDFPGWGLVLNDIRGTGQLSVGGTTPSGLQFEVRDVDARGGGMLRILRGANMIPMPFDRVAIHRIGTVGRGGADLLLEVREALTGRSRAAGGRCSAGCSPDAAVGPASHGHAADWQQAGDALTAVATGRGRPRSGGGGAEGPAAGPGDQFVRGSGCPLRRQRPGTGSARLPCARSAARSGRAGPSLRGQLAAAVVSLAGGRPGAGERQLRRRAGGPGCGCSPPGWRPPPGCPQRCGRCCVAGPRGGWRPAPICGRGRPSLEGLDVTLERDRRGPLPGRLRLHTGSAAPDRPATDPTAGGQPARGALAGRAAVIDGLRALAFGGRLDARATLDLQPAARATASAARRDADPTPSPTWRWTCACRRGSAAGAARHRPGRAAVVRR